MQDGEGRLCLEKEDEKNEKQIEIKSIVRKAVEKWRGIGVCVFRWGYWWMDRRIQ